MRTDNSYAYAISGADKGLYLFHDTSLTFRESDMPARFILNEGNLNFSSYMLEAPHLGLYVLSCRLRHLRRLRVRPPPPGVVYFHWNFVPLLRRLD